MAETATTEGLKVGPDQTLKLAEIVTTNEVENKKGGEPHKRYKVRFEQDKTKLVGLFVPAQAKWTPSVGAEVEGEVINGDYGWEFKRKSQGGGGGGRARSPEENARIQRQHSQDMAIQFLRLSRDLGYEWGDEKWKELMEEFVSLADAFDRDIVAGAAKALARKK